ncbi:MAG TPA: hypothetical protein PKK59_05035 [Anaerolineaceae bacterium]|nr:hypothetical protein [Anaerolineaceae bacterium]
MNHPLPSLLLILSLLLSACAAPTAAPVIPPFTASAAAATTAPLPTVKPTAAITPSPMPVSEPPNPGALSAEQRQALDAAARSYINPTPEGALAAAIDLGYIGRNANPATMCGPLALAILQKAGIVDPSLSLVSFYYLNPRSGHDERYLEQVFPPERFEKIVRGESIKTIDYNTDPLYPGDFLYLFAGDSGSFEHMLVVSRVDETGRAYAVTNLNTPDGVIVDEVMLYDPANPGEGQFYEWTDWENRMIGRTGYGGFWLWRPLP